MADSPLEGLLRLRQHQQEGRRSPHKPLLALMALGNFVRTGDSAVTWSDAEERLAALIKEYGPTSSTAPAQAAAYPFTRLQNDGVWELSADVQVDSVAPLRAQRVTGRFTPAIEAALRQDPAAAGATARVLALSQFPEDLADEVLSAVGLEATDVAVSTDLVPVLEQRRRDPQWRHRVVQSWDRHCAFCGFDGTLGGTTVGLDAAHVRWFAYAGPDELDNGLALCTLHHKLFDRGALGLAPDMTVMVSEHYAATSDAGRRTYDLNGAELRPRPGTALPRTEHVQWHADQVFKHARLAA